MSEPTHFKVGDWVTANHHTRHEPGQVVDIVRLRSLDGTDGPLLRIDFGRFELHLTPDEVSRASNDTA